MNTSLSSDSISNIVTLLHFNYNQLTEFTNTSYIQDLLYPRAFYKLCKNHSNKYELNLTDEALSILYSINHFITIYHTSLSVAEITQNFSSFILETKEKARYSDIVAGDNGRWVYVDNEEALVVEKYYSYLEHKIDEFFGYVPNTRVIVYKCDEFTPILLSYSVETGIIQNLYYSNIDKDLYYRDFCFLLSTLPNIHPVNRWDKPFDKFLKLSCGWFYGD